MTIWVTKNQSILTATISGMATNRNVLTAAMEQWKSKCHRIVNLLLNPRQYENVRKIFLTLIRRSSPWYAYYPSDSLRRLPVRFSETIEDIYDFKTSEEFISNVTDKLPPQIEDWKNRPLDEIYPIIYIDAIHYFVRDNGVIQKLAAYVILGINTEDKKEVLSIRVGDNESTKH